MEFFLRFCARMETLPNRTPVRAYDERFLFVLSGKGELHLTDRTLPIAENTLCYYPAGTQYFPCAREADTFSFITVNFDFSTRYAERTKSHHPVPISEPFDEALFKPTHLDFPHERFHEPFVLEGVAHLREHFLKLEREMNSSLPFAKERASAVLSYIIYSILGQGERDEKTLVRTLCDYLSENYRTISSNEEVARALNYHESYLNKMMREHMGTTVHQYINRKRLGEAEQLLLYSQMSVEEICERVGFVNTKHFSTLFRHKYGVSPSKYRKRGKWI